MGFKKIQNLFIYLITEQNEENTILYYSSNNTKYSKIKIYFLMLKLETEFSDVQYLKKVREKKKRILKN